MSDLHATIRGIQEAQRANEQVIAAVRPSWALGRAVVYVTTQAHRRGVYHTPWDTGGLRAAHRMKIEGGGSRGRVFIAPNAVNPRQGGRRPADYGARLHAQGQIPGRRGGIRAFYEYTVQQEGPQILQRGGAIILEALP